MTNNYVIQFYLEGGKSLELEMNEQKFNEISTFCDEILPEKEWTLTETTKNH